MNRIMQAGVGAIVAGGMEPGWVSGDVASLAASASVNCVFDLGQNWQNFKELTWLIHPVAPSSGFSNVYGHFSDTTSADTRRRPPQLGASGNPSTNFGSSLTTANGVQGCNIPVMGRYFTLSATNADGANAMGATAAVFVGVRD